MTPVIASIVTMVGSIVTAIIASVATYYMTKLRGSIDAAAKAADVAAKVAEMDRKIAQEEREAVRVAARHVADKVDAVRQALETTVSVGSQKLDDIKKLVDGRMTAQLKISEQALRTIARFTGNAADVEAADRAGQKVVDQEAIVAAAETDDDE